MVLVPTRNRAHLAMSAVRSVLEQAGGDIQILVSDNSTMPAESRSLADFCARLSERGDAPLCYTVPPQPLAMPQHWDWAIQQASELSAASHFTILTDRMIFLQGQLRPLIEHVKRHPDSVISYSHDRIVDYTTPVRLERQPWTGVLLPVTSSRLLYLTSRTQLHQALPRMLNCVVPREILKRIREKYFTVFNSVAPDFNFCFRCLDTVDSIIYYDRPILLHYALNRSHGESTARGILSEDAADFIANLHKKTMNYAAPVPGFRTVHNTIYSEYCSARQAAKNRQFPQIDFKAYLRDIAHEVRRLENADLRAEMERLLLVQGWTGEASNGGCSPRSAPRILASWANPARASLLQEGTPIRTLDLHVRSCVRGLVHRAGALFSMGKRFLRVPKYLSHRELLQILIEHLRFRAAPASEVEFLTREDAIAYANSFPKRASLRLDRLMILVDESAAQNET